jgi:hypothetical protein
MKRAIFALLILLIASPSFAGGMVVGSGAAGAWETCVSNTSTGQSTDGATRNWRFFLPANTCAHSGSKVRITVKAASAGGGGTITGASIGTQGVDTRDFAATPTRITWSTSNSATVAQGTELVSDEITYTFNKASVNGVHIYVTDRDFVITGSTPYSAEIYYDANVSDETLVNMNSPSGPDDSMMAVIKLEVYVP